MTDLAELKQRAKQGDAKALQILRERGFFKQQPTASPGYPLSHAQKRLWLLEQLNESSAVYNIPGVVRLTGTLDENRFEQAITALLQRHESLRTVFRDNDGKPRQIIQAHSTFNLTKLDLTASDDALTQLNRHLSQNAEQPFDLSTGPLLRASLIKLAPTEWVFAFAIHHIVCDEWSLGIMLDDLRAGYEGQTLAPLKLHYKDYAAWQNAQLKTPQAAKHQAYWRQQLSGELTVLELPIDFPRPPIMTFTGDTLAFDIDSANVKALKQLAQAHHASLFMALTTLVKILLHRYSGQTDISIGSPVTGRNHPDLENQIGFYVNMLVLRDNIEPSASFSALLQQVKGSVEAAYEHQLIPFDKLVSEFDTTRDLSRSPLFDVAIAMHTGDHRSVHLGAVQLTEFEQNAAIAKYDLTFNFTDLTDRLTVGINYRSDLFAADTIERMGAHFSHLLNAAVAEPNRAISHLKLLSNDETRQLQSWNATNKTPPDTHFMALFERQAVATPDAPALLFAEQTLSYAELNAQANRLAHALIARQVSAETIIGLNIPRSPAAIVGILGILKAGAAYLPLDPDYPQQRLQFMLDDSKAPLLLTLENFKTQWPNSVHCFCLDSDAATLDAFPVHNPDIAITPEQLAYVIYTSGSTGQPKGVMLEHRGLSNLIQAQAEAFAVTPDSRVLQFASLSFDAAVSEIAVTLSVGACLHLGHGDKFLPDADFINLLKNDAITHVTLPPSFLQLLPVIPCPQLQTLVVAGEACPGELVNTWSAGRRFINAYGPTEATVCTSLMHCTQTSATPPIGYPLSNTRCYILDAEHQPVPIGIAGELCISGIGLARGYLNRPELTAEKFINIELFGEPVRIYKTGDRGKWRSDGTLHYLGRLDEQVKLRGFRIELGEISERLRQHPALNEVAVTIYDDAKTGQQLVAFIIFKTGQSTEPSELRAYLKNTCPDFMLPSTFIVLEHLPLTANGKIDRKQLQQYARQHAPQSQMYAAPNTETERRLLAIWSAILDTEHLGINDNFFERGGHSLLATQIIAQIQRQLAIKISLRELFQHPTIAELAIIIEQLGRHDIMAIEPAPAAAHYPLSHAQHRLWVLDKMGAQQAAYNIVGAILLEGELVIAALQDALNSLIERHESLRTRFCEMDGSGRQSIHNSRPLSLAVIDLSTSANPEQTAREHIDREAAKAFDLSHDHLLRAQLYKLDSQRFVFVLVLHHIISDGWSLDIFLKELLTFYHGDSLPPLPIQYKDYACWQHQPLHLQNLATSRSYWLNKLKGPVPALDLPADFSRPAVSSFNGGSIVTTLPADATQALRQLCQTQGASLFMGLLALVKTLLFRYTHQSDIIVGSTIAGRDHPDTHEQIGFFVNMLALRDHLQHAHSFTKILTQVKQTVSEAFEHQDYPFDHLVDELELVRDMSRNPLFDVAVTMLQTTRQTMPKLDGLTASEFPYHASTSKFDLTFAFTDLPDQSCLVGIEYSSDLFSGARIERLATHLQTLLRAIIAEPEAAIAKLPIIPDAEQRKLLHDFNQTARPYPKSQSIAELFAQQAARTPDAAAVIFGDTTLTYRELNRRANGVAKALSQHFGIAHEDCVGVLLARSEQTIIALLGILKAGAAYVPIDPVYPVQRIDFIIQDTACRVVIAQTEHSVHLAEQHPELSILDPNALTIEASDTHPPTQADGRSLAYIIYTSGSTGQPKGAMIRQYAIARLVLNTNYIDIKPDNRILQTGSLAFDASTFEIWGALLNGARLYLPTDTILLEIVELKKLLLKHRIDTMFLTTGLFNQWVEADITLFQTLKTLLMGGEKVSASHVGRLLKSHPDLHFKHVYGPTENTTFSTYYPVSAVSDDDIPIGFPISNSTVYILDARGQLAPIGIPGELHTGGDGVALGYLKQPALTAEKFIRNPFAPDDLLYRTGDLARWREDGAIEFIGRIDNQVKVRGFRIEPGEIEAQILQFPGIKQVSVIAVTSTVGTQELAAYVAGSDALSTQELADFLSTGLPAYMIPAHIIKLDHLPLTINGKIDTRTLPPVATAGTTRPGSGVVPRNDLEALVLDIWRAVLNRDDLGVTDHYFENGGDSIKAIQISSRLMAQGWRMTVRDLFTHPTVAGLAPLLVGGDQNPQDQQPVQGPVPLTAIQHWFFQQPVDGRTQAHFNQAVLLQPNIRLHSDTLKKALEVLQTHHDALRMTYTTDADTHQHNAGLDHPCAFEYLDLTATPAPETAMAQHIETAHTGFDLGHGPLLKTVLYRLPTSDRVLLVIHHLVIDGLSWRILLEDLELAYRQSSAHQAPLLPTKTVSFQAWAQAANAYANSESLHQESTYWRNLLHQAEQAKALPTDHDGTDNRFGDLNTEAFTLSPEHTQMLLTGTHQAYHTEINDILLTALAGALQQWRDGYTLITLEGHGREPLQQAFDLSRSVGWFTSMYPFLLGITEVDIGAQLKQVKEALRAVPNKGVGFGLLKYLSAPPVLPDANITPQLSFNYLGQFDESGAHDGLFHFAEESSGTPISPYFPRQHALDITGMIVRGRLQLTVAFNPKRHRQATIATFTDHFRLALIDLIDHCHSRTQSEKTPADFSLTPFTLTQYQAFLQREQLQAHVIDDIYPLSPMQQGLLFESLYQRQDNAYTIQTAYRLNGTIDRHIFEQSWQQLSRRHAILRTAFFHEQLEQPLQVVFKDRPPLIDFQDLSALPHTVQQEHIHAYLHEDLQRGFDLHRDPLMRIGVLQFGPEQFHIVWSYHHIVFDGWCLGLVYNDLLTLYQALTQRQALPPEPTAVYADYIRWLANQDKTQALAYWRAYLSAYEQLATLPKRAVAAQTPHHERGDCYFELPDTEAITQLCNRLGVTLNTLIQGLWGVLLSRYNNTQDVIFGAIVSGRPPTLPGADTMVGLFINAIPVRIRFDAEQSFKQLLQQVQSAALAGENYHYLPLTDIQALTDIDLFDHLIVFENYPLAQAATQHDDETTVDWRIDDVKVHDRTHYDFDITVLPGTTVAINFSFNPHVYSAEQIARTQHHFLTLLADLLSAPERPIRQANIVPTAELRCFDAFNATALTYPDALTIVDLFEQQVAQQPEEAIAVSFAGQNLSYRALNARANAIAHHLLSVGAGPEQRIGLCVERSPAMIIGVWAILKSGAAYVPLDPLYPQERLHFMLADAQISLLLSQPRCAPLLPDAINLIDLDGDFTGYPDSNPRRQARPEHLAYTIYTSGSTGQPKGVMVEHRNLTHAAYAWRQAYRLDSFDIRLLQMASLSFDVFAGDLIRALCHGGRLVICPFDALLEPDALYTLLSQYRITILESTPGLLVPLMDFIAEQALPVDFLKLLIIGSDVLTVNDYRRLSARFGKQLRLINSYGLTEATIDSGFFEGELPAFNQSLSTPIGKPLANTRYYIFDSHGHLTPLGVFGELYIGGLGVARGYLNRDSLTAERFVAHPAQPGERLYKTGDLARWLPDGNVEFMQRADDQVKIRGFRVELGEVEKQLLTFPKITQAVVLAPVFNAQPPQLVAYIVTEEEIDRQILREFMLTRLPDYMVPNFFVHMETLPLTANGKINKKTLPAPNAEALALTHVYCAPRNRLEQQLAELWQTILQLERIGIHDNFFELGGHSLKAMQLMSRIHQHLNVKLPLRTLFDAPSIAEQAALLAAAETSQFRFIPQAPTQEDYPLSYAQTRLWFLDRLSADARSAYNMPAAFEFRRKPDMLALNQAFSALIERHDMLRTAFIERGGEPRQKIYPELTFTITEVDLSGQDETALQHAIDREAARPFDLQQPPLLRACLLTAAGNRFVFVLTLHHIIGDGWSENVLFRELMALYQACQNAKPYPLQPLRIQYKDYVVWQAAKGFEQEEHYWLKQLANLPPRLNMHYDLPAAAERDFRGDITTLMLEPELTEKLQAFALAKKTTLSNTILALFNLLLFQLTKQPDFAIGLSVANRNHPDLENLIGFFINILPIRIRFSDDMEFDELLTQVSQNVEAAFEHQDYPFDLMIQKLNPARSATRQPLLNIVYTFQNFHDVHIDIGDTTADQPYAAQQNSDGDEAVNYPIGFKTSKFDLTLFVSEYNNNLQLDMEYDTGLFLPATIMRHLNLLKHFAQMLTSN